MQYKYKPSNGFSERLKCYCYVLGRLCCRTNGGISYVKHDMSFLLSITTNIRYNHNKEVKCYINKYFIMLYQIVYMYFTCL